MKRWRCGRGQEHAGGEDTVSLEWLKSREEAVQAIQRRMWRSSAVTAVWSLFLAVGSWTLVWLLKSGIPGHGPSRASLSILIHEISEAVDGASALAVTGAWLGLGVTLIIAVALNDYVHSGQKVPAGAASVALVRWLETTARVVLGVACAISLAAIPTMSLGRPAGIAGAAVLGATGLVAALLSGLVSESREDLMLRDEEMKEQEERAQAAVNHLSVTWNVLTSYSIVLIVSLVPLGFLALIALVRSSWPNLGWWLMIAGVLVIVNCYLAWSRATEETSRTIRQRRSVPVVVMVFFGVVVALLSAALGVALVLLAWPQAAPWSTVVVGVVLGAMPWVMWGINRGAGAYRGATSLELNAEVRRIAKRRQALREQLKAHDIRPTAG